MKKKIVKMFILSIVSSFCLATPICAAESDNAAAFEEEQYTLWLENYEDELEIGEFQKLRKGKKDIMSVWEILSIFAVLNMKS